MQYLLSVIDDGQAAAAGNDSSATPEEEAGVDAFNARLQAEGRWVFAGGLGGPDAARTVDDRAGAGLVTDGPFVESTEYLAGFWVVEAADRDEALALAAAGSRACNRRVEVRQFL
jgi:hypothetical protein